MLFATLSQDAYLDLLRNRGNSRLTGATSRYNRTFHPLDYANHAKPNSLRTKLAYSVRSVALFVFTLGIYHLHVRRLANHEWKLILCDRANNPPCNHEADLQSSLKVRVDQAKEIEQLKNDLFQARSQTETALQEPRQKLEQQASEIQRLHKLLNEANSDKSAQFGESRHELENRDGQIKRLQEDLEIQAAAFTTLKKQWLEAQSERDAKAKEIEEKNARIDSEKNANEVMAKEFGELVESLNGQISELEGKLILKDKEIERWKEQVTFKDMPRLVDAQEYELMQLVQNFAKPLKEVQEESGSEEVLEDTVEDSSQSSGSSPKAEATGQEESQDADSSSEM